MQYKRLTLFSGHYGSGKTNIAVNYAVWLRQQNLPVTIADLDIVNPYFRTKDSEEYLKSLGIPLISSFTANSNVDTPAVPKEVYGLVGDSSVHGVLDIGGDDRGALALGRFVPGILEENDYEHLFVINKSRPLTRTADDTISILHEIEDACKLPFCAIVNNTNLGLETMPDDILRSVDYANEVSVKSGLPVKMTCAADGVYQELEGKVENLFLLKLQKLYYMNTAEVRYGKVNI